MKIKNEKELLELFVEKDYTERFTRPFLNEYYEPSVWATNRQILIVVRKNCITGEYPKEKVQIRGLEERNFYSVVTKQALQDALGKCEQVEEEIITGKYEECDECSSSGKVEWEYTDKYGNTHYEYHDCPFCDGTGLSEEPKRRKTGKMIANPENYVRIDAMAAKVSEVQIVIKAMELLGIDEMYHYVNANIKPNLFIIDNNIKLIWMGRACDDDMELVKVETYESK